MSLFILILIVCLFVNIKQKLARNQGKNTVGIQELNMSGIWIVQVCSIIKWHIIFGCQIRPKTSHLNAS